MKKNLLSFILLLASSAGFAAPYHFAAPINEYSWGETIASVKKEVADADIDRITKDSYYVQQEDHIILLRFWHDRLISMTYLPEKQLHHLEVPEKEALYQKQLKQFKQQWGEPVDAGQCEAHTLVCTRLTWRPTAETSVTLYRNTLEQDLYFSYEYNDSKMYPLFETENAELGYEWQLSSLLHYFETRPEEAQQYLGKRIRIEGRVERISPLLITARGPEAECIVRDSKETAGILLRKIITVSGVLSKVEGNQVHLADVTVVPDKADDVAYNRKGKQPQGYFAAEMLRNQLEHAANRIEENFSLREYLLPPRMEGDMAVYEFMSEKAFSGVSFSLDKLKADMSGDTLSLNVRITEGQREPNGYFLMACMLLMFSVSQPEQAPEALLDKVHDVLKGEKDGRVVINGWTYRLTYKNDHDFTFSAIAPKGSKK